MQITTLGLELRFLILMSVIILGAIVATSSSPKIAGAFESIHSFGSWKAAGGATAGVRGISVDSAGNVYVTGAVERGVPTSPYTYVSDSDLLLLKYKSTGNIDWVSVRGVIGGTDPSQEYGASTAVDSAGNVYVVGYYLPPLPRAANDMRIIVMKYKSNGTIVWERLWNMTGDETDPVGVAVDAFGNLFVAGYVQYYNSGQKDILLIKFNSTGIVQWTRDWRWTANTLASGVRVDSSGNIYIAGYNNNAIFILKSDTLGNLIWQRGWGLTNSTLEASGIAVDTIGDVYLGGNVNTGEGDHALLIKANSTTGQLIWQRTWGGSSGGLVTDIASVNSSRLYALGITGSPGSIACNPYPYFNPYGDCLPFIAWLDQDGNMLWQRVFGVEAISTLGQIGADANGNAFLLGYPYSDPILGQPRFVMNYSSLSSVTPNMQTVNIASRTTNLGSYDSTPQASTASSPFVLKYVPPPLSNRFSDFELNVTKLSLNTTSDIVAKYNVSIISTGNFSEPVTLNTTLTVCTTPPPVAYATSYEAYFWGECRHATSSNILQVSFAAPTITPPPNGTAGTTLTLRLAKAGGMIGYDLAVVGRNTNLSRFDRVSISYQVGWPWQPWPYPITRPRSITPEAIFLIIVPVLILGRARSKFPRASYRR